MRTRIGLVVALLVLGAATENGLAEAQTPAPTLKQGDLGILSTATMPDGIRVEVVQSGIFQLDPNGQLVRIGGDLNYFFSFPSARKISATVAQSDTGEPTFILCSPTPTGRVPFSQCSGWLELRQVLMTLYALGSSNIVALDGGDQVTVDRAAFGITNADIVAWVARATDPT